MDHSHRRLITIPRLRKRGAIDTRHPGPDLDDMESEGVPRLSPLAAELGHAIAATPVTGIPWECPHAGHFSAYAAPFMEIQTERGTLLVHPAAFRVARIPGESSYRPPHDPIAPLYQQDVLIGLGPDATYDATPSGHPLPAQERKVLGRGLDALLGSSTGLPIGALSTRVVALRAVLMDRTGDLLVLAQASGLVAQEYQELCMGEKAVTPRRDATFAIPVGSVSSLRAYRAS